MADYAPPDGPPPPKVPEGWVAQWNDQYKEWFYVNTYTKQSQWEKPTEPIYPPNQNEFAAPGGAPPVYDHSTAQPVSDSKTGSSHLSSNNPYGPGGPGGSASASHQNVSEDERLARQLQAEEEARMRSPSNAGAGDANRGASDSYYNQGNATGSYGGTPPALGGDQLPPRPDETSRGKSKGGFLGKLLGKAKSSSSGSHYGQQPAYGQPQYGNQYGGYPPQQGHFQPHGPPMGQYGGYPPQQGYYGGPHGYGPPPQQMYGRRPGGGGGGLGAGGAMALGVGGGLVGGALLAEGLDGGDDGGDCDDGGGDMDDGGGDF